MPGNRQVRAGQTFSAREIEVLTEIARGSNAQEVGNMLFIEAKTVHFHERNMRIKAKVKNRQALINFAAKNKYIDLGKGL